MRTTVTLDNDVLLAARSLARARAVSLGAALSELARKGIECGRAEADEGGFPVFRVAPGTSPITLEHVRTWEDEM